MYSRPDFGVSYKRSGTRRFGRLRSSAAWTFAVLWIISATYLAWKGHTGISLFALGKITVVVVFTILTVGLTASASERPGNAQQAT